MLNKILVCVILFIIFNDIFFLYNYYVLSTTKINISEESKKVIKINEKKLIQKKIISEMVQKKLNQKNPENQLNYGQLLQQEYIRNDNTNFNQKQLINSDANNYNYQPPSNNDFPMSSENYQNQDLDLDEYAEDTIDEINIKQKSINEFGKPSEYDKDNYIMWEFMDPEPWTKIIYKYHEDEYTFFIKVKIPSLNDYQSWKNIIKNIDFNPRSGELIIITKNEESALAIANLIVSNFSGNISIDDIIKKDLINVSIIKATKYDVVKNKLREQIMTILNPPKITNSNMDFQTDLATNNSSHQFIDGGPPKENKKEEFTAWEGNEYSFIN